MNDVFSRRNSKKHKSEGSTYSNNTGYTKR